MNKDLKLRGHEKRAFEEWEQLVQMVQTTTADDLKLTPKQREEMREKVVKDPRLFEQRYLPRLKHSPDWKIREMKRILKDPFYFGWLMWARGLGKNVMLITEIPMMLMALELVTGEPYMQVFLYAASNERIAGRDLMALQANLQYNKRFINDFGEMYQWGHWAEGEFQTRNGNMIVGIGAGQQARGTNLVFERPDYVVVNDIENRDLAKNPQRCQELADWFLGDLFGMEEQGSDRYRMIYANNRPYKITVGQAILDTAEPGSFRVHQQDTLDKNGKPNAPYVTMEWVKKKQRAGYRNFQREYMNNPIDVGNLIDPEQYIWERLKPLKSYKRLVAYFDPSFGGKNSDYMAIRVWGRWLEQLHQLATYCRQGEGIDSAIRWMYDYYELTRNKTSVAFWMERQFYNAPFMAAIKREAKRRGYTLPIRMDMRKKKEKLTRYESTVVPYYEQRLIRHNLKEKELPDAIVARDQVLAFGPGSKVNDDAPDADEGAIFLLISQGMTDVGSYTAGGSRGQERF